jgi:hypothetical protein
MSALFGKTDPLLELERFHRFLRQAHDAEVADVRVVGENEYEVSTRPGFRYERSATAARPTTDPVTTESSQAPAVEALAEPAGNGKRAGIRFRRGSRGVMARADVPMVGVVKVDEPVAPAKPAAPVSGSGRTKGAKSPRQRKPKAAAATPVPEAAPEQPAAVPRRPRRPRAKNA